MDPLAIGIWFVSKSSELESIWVRNCHGSGYEGHKYHQDPPGNQSPHLNRLEPGSSSHGGIVRHNGHPVLLATLE